nr:small integral membrane protein 4 [Saimiri boliviensis boliviensis]
MREGHHFYQDVRNKNGGGRVEGSLLNSLPHRGGQEAGPGRRHVGCPPVWAAPPPELRRLRSCFRPCSASRSTRALQYSDWRLRLAVEGHRPAPALVRLPDSGGGRRSLVVQAAVHGENARSGLGCVRAIQCLVPPYPFPGPRSSMFPKAQVRRILQRVPGKRRFGIYRFLPFFFVLGGTMEWIMINIRVGQETFYDVYRRKASERQYQRRLEDE